MAFITLGGVGVARRDRMPSPSPARTPPTPRLPLETAPTVAAADVAPDVRQVRRKHPVPALLASLVVPGLGQAVNGQSRKGLVLGVGFVVSLMLSPVLVGIPVAVGLWAWAMHDAYRYAKGWNEPATAVP